jgi:hypothetical protein
MSAFTSGIGTNGPTAMSAVLPQLRDERKCPKWSILTAIDPRSNIGRGPNGECPTLPEAVFAVDAHCLRETMELRLWHLSRPKGNANANVEPLYIGWRAFDRLRQ